MTNETETLTPMQMAEAIGVSFDEYQRWAALGNLQKSMPFYNTLDGVQEWLEYIGVDEIRKEYQHYADQRAAAKRISRELLHPELAADTGPRQPVTERIINFDTPPQRDPDLVEGWLPAGGITVMYGPPGAGKSFLALDMALAVHNGETSVLGAAFNAPVTYILGEGVAGIGERVGAWQAKAGGDTAVPRFVNGLDLGDDQDLAELAATLDQGALLVIDTLSRCTPGIDENSTKDMSRIVANLDWIREAKGVTILVVHHSGKDARRGARGSTVLVGAVDAEIQVAGDVGDTVLVTSTKRRDGEGGGTAALVARDIANSMVLEQKANEPAQWTEVLEALEDGMTSSEWTEASGLSAPTFRKNRRWLMSTGRVLAEGRGRGGRYFAV